MPETPANPAPEQPAPAMTTEQAEHLLGTLIRLLNPYTDTMHYPAGNPAPDAVQQPAAPNPGQRAQLAQYQLEVDNRYGSQNGGDYLSWEFKGQPQIIKKAVKIQFRHPGNGGNYLITDHLLIGFAGSNGP